MNLDKRAIVEIGQLWMEHEVLIINLMSQLEIQYMSELGRPATEWETTRQMIEFTAKRQALVDLKRILEKRYE